MQAALGHRTASWWRSWVWNSAHVPGKAAVVFMYDFTVEYAGPNRVSVMYFPPVVDLLYMPKALSKARGVYGEEPGPN